MKYRLLPSFFTFALLLALLPGGNTLAAVLDPESPENGVLDSLQAVLTDAGVQSARNLNSRRALNVRLDKPRIGAFSDLPIDTLSNSEEIDAWEEEYLSGDLGAIIFLASTVTNSPLTQFPEKKAPLVDDQFLQSWFRAEAHQRVFLTINKADFQWNQSLLSAIRKQGYIAQLLVLSTPMLALMNEQQKSVHAATPGRYYATAGQRWGFDSKSARRSKSKVSEITFLGKRVRRDSNSIFKSNDRATRRIARAEPSVFRKIGLGDEYAASTIEEIIVPGGIALGETAKMALPLSELRFSNGELRLLNGEGDSWVLPHEQSATLKSLFDFAHRAEMINSDAIVDIDENGAVKISAALRDTDVGFEMVRIDSLPFSFVRNLPVRKSVIIDTSVNFFESAPSRLDYKCEFEVRFLRADSMRVAQTKIALVYEYNSTDELVNYSDQWGSDLHRLNESTDFEGLGSDISRVAAYAAWIALFRSVSSGELSFLQGRYAFMKIDKSGRSTPRRT